MNINEIAKLAGVSKRTVTRALHDSYGIKKETKDRVLRIIEQYNYRPSSVARALTTGKSRVLGLLVPESRNPFYAKLVMAVEEACDKCGYNVLLMNTYRNRDKEIKSISLCVEKMVDGILITPIQTADKVSLLALEKSGLPFVLMNRHYNKRETSYVINDNVLGGYLVTSHLLGHAYEQIAYLTSSLNTSSARERLAGYKKALKEHGLPFDKALVAETAPTIDGGAAALEKLWDILRTKRSGIFAFCDLMAAGASRFLKKKGLAIGVDIGLAGYDDIDLASFMEPPLTTVSQPSYDIGRIAAEILLEKLAGNDGKAQQTILPPSLLVRASCGCEYE